MRLSTIPTTFLHLFLSKLRERRPKFLWDWHTRFRGIFDDRKPFVADEEPHDNRLHKCLTYHAVREVGDDDEQDNHELFADAAEATLT